MEVHGFDEVAQEAAISGAHGGAEEASGVFQRALNRLVDVKQGCILRRPGEREAAARPTEGGDQPGPCETLEDLREVGPGGGKAIRDLPHGKATRFGGGEKRHRVQGKGGGV